MNMQPVTGTPVMLTCCQCNTRRASNQVRMFADQDGTPWQAYYCEPCANLTTAAKRLEEFTEGPCRYVHTNNRSKEP